MAFRRLVKAQQLPYEYTMADSLAQATDAIGTLRFDVIVTDYWLGDGTGFDVMHAAQGTPVIVVTGAGDEQVAVKAMKLGAYDYMIKDGGCEHLKMLPMLVQNAMMHKRNADKLRKYRRDLENLTRRRELERAKREFTSSVSHELRTPLTVIKSHVATILRDPNMPAQTRHRFLTIVNEQADCLARLIDGILQLSAADSAKLRLDCKPLDLPALSESIIERLQILSAEKSLKVSTSFAPELDRLVCDQEKIHSMLTNLLSNAVKFTPHNGKVSLSLRRTDEAFVISVSDTGVGIPQDALGRIFDRFYRVDNGPDQVPGTGLGLAIVKEIVDLHQGRIQVESRPGKGTTFTVTLPLPSTHTSEP